MPKAFDVVVTQEYVNKKKYFVVNCLNLNLTSQGKSVEEALKNIKDAVRLYLEENPGETPKIERLSMPLTTTVIIE